MEPFLTRGYVFGTTLKYVRQGLAPERRERALSLISPDTIQWTETLQKPAEMYPVARSVEMFDAIAAASGGDEKIAEEDLIGCGMFAADEAMNTFLKLLMRVLTPSLFAKKLPSLYARDNSQGNVAVKVSDESLSCTMKGIGGYKHVGPISVGWSAFTLGRMGKKLRSTKLEGWSLATPSPEDFSFELAWER